MYTALLLLLLLLCHCILCFCLMLFDRTATTTAHPRLCGKACHVAEEWQASCLLQASAPRMLARLWCFDPNACCCLCVCVSQGTGSSIDYLTPAAAVSRVLTGVPQIIGGGRFFDKDGNRVNQEQKAAAAVYNSAGVRVLFDYPPEQY